MGVFTDFEKTVPSLAGKVFVITGTTSGTGFVAAQTAAKHGGEVVLLNRPSKRSEDSLEKLRAAVPGGKFVAIPCDLQDFASVRTACGEIKAKYDKVYCLANNAGIMAHDDIATKDKFDIQMQTNHLSHFLLTAELFPLLVNAEEEYGDARIVQHSSGARQGTRNGLEEKYFGPNGGNLGGNAVGMFSGPNFYRYCQSKLANSVFSHALHEKLQAKGMKIRAVCAHPGGSKTSLFAHLDQAAFSNFNLQSAEDGAVGLMKGMMDPNAGSGKLYGPNGFSGPVYDLPLRSYETDAASKKMLWEMSEEATGVKFDI